MLKSRKLIKKTISNTGVEVSQCWCRKCLKFKRPIEFFTATDYYLDANGYMSICKDCIDLMYKNTYAVEKSIDRTILKLCRILNVKYSEEVMGTVYLKLENKEKKGITRKEDDNVFGLYKASLSAGSKNLRISLDSDQTNPDLTFVEPSAESVQALYENEIYEQEYYENAWGKGLTQEDYLFLESEFSKWKKTTKCDTQSEEILVREICHKQNEIRKARISQQPTDGLVRGLQEIMKNSALTPALQNAATSGKGAETFGVWVKEIEQISPAEWYEKQEKFRDMDGLEQDKKDIVRSIGNFITGSREFNTSEIESLKEEEDNEGIFLNDTEIT